MNASPVKAGAVDETRALIRRLRRAGIRDVEIAAVGRGRYAARARVQDGRSHRRVVSDPSVSEVAALESLADEIRRRPARRPRPAIAASAPVARPNLDPPPPVDEPPIGVALEAIAAARAQKAATRAEQARERRTALQARNAARTGERSARQPTQAGPVDPPVPHGRPR